jgi:hypothetical protein
VIRAKSTSSRWNRLPDARVTSPDGNMIASRSLTSLILTFGNVVWLGRIVGFTVSVDPTLVVLTLQRGFNLPARGSVDGHRPPPSPALEGV